MSILRKITDFYLYSSIHIAIGAALSVILCYASLFHIPNSDYALFVFSSTLFLYCAHRIVGIKKVRAFEHQGRFAVIRKFRTHLIIYAIIGLTASFYFFLTLTLTLKILLSIPAIISTLYILPVFAKNRRLRDFHLLKIFLIAFSWSLIIGFIPYIEGNENLGLHGVLYTLDKFFFIFAITIPFDIRDLKVDNANNVETLPSRIGIKRSYLLAHSLLLLSMIIISVLMVRDFYSIKMGLGIQAGYFLSHLGIHFTRGKRDDYFYSGLLDGSIALVALLGIATSGILSIIF